MTQKFANNGRALLQGAIGALDTSMTIEAGKADRFPVATTTTWVTPLDWFKVTLVDSLGNIEIVKVGTRTLGSGALGNVLRGQDGTTARSFSIGSVAVHAVTAADMANVDELRADIFDADSPLKGTALVGHLAAVTGAVGQTARDVLNQIVFAASVAPVGNGIADDTTKLQNVLNAAAGKTLILSGSATYGYTFLTIKANTTLVTNGATLKRLTASTSHGITIEAGVSFDSLTISTPGGTAGDKAILIKGSGVRGDFVSVTAIAEGLYTSANWAIEIDSGDSVSYLSRINIKSMFCRNMSTAIFAKRLYFSSIANGAVEKYRTAVYLRDVAYSSFNNFKCKELGNAVNGAPGENGLLIESSLLSGSSSNLQFDNWVVEDAGEHSYRLGGQLTIRDVYFNNCVSRRSGSAILGGNTTSGEWHGGCGFKVLGGTSTLTERHQNIYFTKCRVEDCSTTFGSYPSGHGVNNFTPYLIVSANNVHFTDCSTGAVGKPVAARNGILFTAVNGLYLNNSEFKDIDLVPIKPFEETPVGGFPGADMPIENLVINGGLYESVTASVGEGLCLYMAEAAKYAHKNWTMKGAVLKGGASAFRLNTVSTGSYENIDFDFKYLDTNVDNSTFGTPIIAGGNYARVTARGPWRPAAYGISVLDASTFQGDDGVFRTRVSGAWSISDTRYGTWSPVLTNIANLDSSAVNNVASWSRVGNVVTAGGNLIVDPAEGGVFSLEMTPPIASNFTSFAQACGTFASSDGTMVGSISAQATTDKLTVSGSTTVASARNIAFQVMYRVL